MALSYGETTCDNDEMAWSGWDWKKGTMKTDSRRPHGNFSFPFFIGQRIISLLLFHPLFLLHHCLLDTILQNSFWQHKRKRSQQLTSSSICSCWKRCTFRNSKINYFNLKFSSLNSRARLRNTSTVATLQWASWSHWKITWFSKDQKADAQKKTFRGRINHVWNV